jgi:hypothetical protein
MNLGEEYRWNVPTLYYSFSADFLTYFGQRGVDEIEKAIKVLNDLPAVDDINVDDYPLQSQRINHQASQLILYDLKSQALSILLNQRGITDPTRYVFTLRNRWNPANATNYFVIMRNFDPVTSEPTPFINGQLWTYTTILELQTGESYAVTEPVDPLALGGLINTPVTGEAVSAWLQYGGFWTGLTRDDVGGLKYVYRSSNLNVENAPPGVSSFVAGTPVLSDGGGAGGSPWSVPVVTVPGTTPGGTPGAPAAGTNYVNTGLRPGIPRIRMIRVDADSLLGSFPSNNVSYVDRVITNGNTIQQTLVRPLLAPDILFDARDLQGADTAQIHIILQDGNQAGAWVNNDAVNGVAGNDGPGSIQPLGNATPVFVISFNKVGPIFANSQPFFLSEASAARGYQWGSFDGSATPPLIYPNAASIAEVEEAVLGGEGGGGGGVGGGSLVNVWTPAAVNVTAINTGTAAGGGGAGTTP